MTAEAMYCRQIVAEALGSELDDQSADEATAALVALAPEPGRVNLYYWYYGTLALHHQAGVGPRGGRGVADSGTRRCRWRW